jgi:hypothetical protein
VIFFLFFFFVHDQFFHVYAIKTRQSNPRTPINAIDATVQGIPMNKK